METNYPLKFGEMPRIKGTSRVVVTLFGPEELFEKEPIKTGIQAVDEWLTQVDARLTQELSGRENEIVLLLPRNPVLFGIFHRLGLIEKVGSGINRIKELVRTRKLKVTFEVDEFFKVVFSRPKETAKTSEKTSEKILALMKENPSLSARDIADEIRRTPRAVEMQIAHLKQKGIIKRIGPPKGGTWRIMKYFPGSDDQDDKKR